MDAALREHRLPRCEGAVVCSVELSVREIGERLVESPNGMAVLTDPETGEIKGLVTLHDLLRAQVSVAE